MALGSSSPALSDKSIYPKLFRCGGPESAHNPAKVIFTKHFGWRRVATLQESLSIFSTVRIIYVSANSKAYLKSIFVILKSKYFSVALGFLDSWIGSGRHLV